jgi:hypothetical protein
MPARPGQAHRRSHAVARRLTHRTVYDSGVLAGSCSPRPGATCCRLANSTAARNSISSSTACSFASETAGRSAWSSPARRRIDAPGKVPSSRPTLIWSSSSSKLSPRANARRCSPGPSCACCAAGTALNAARGARCRDAGRTGRRLLDVRRETRRATVPGRDPTTVGWARARSGLGHLHPDLARCAVSLPALRPPR